MILGGGTAGWMAAAAFASLLPRQRYNVTLVESEQIGIVGVGEATLPQMKNFNDLIAIDEAEMMRSSKATFKLGIEFVDWGFVGSSYIHPFGIHGPPASGLPFHHRWLRSVLAGRDWDIEEFSFAIAAARANRFDFPSTGRPTINSTYAYAYHFDASLYAAYLRGLAERRGAVRIEGKVADVEQDAATGDIRALLMESGQRVEGDFFIDCSGFGSLLLGNRLDVQWEDWSKWLPCDRALAVPTERQAELTPFTQSRAMEAGWRWRIPLQHRTGNGYVFSSSFTDEARAAEVLLASVGTQPLAEPRLLKFQAGRRVTNWERNCVALGLASGFLEPLESTSIYLIQIAIMHLLPLFPSRKLDPRLSREFNLRMDLEYERIRDFLILHYHLNQRDDAEIWRYCRNMEVPESLHRKIALFRISGYIQDYRDGLFNPPSWLSVLLGQGLRPQHYHPLADSLAADRLIDELDDLRTEIRDRVDEMPKHATFVARYADAHEVSEAALRQSEARL